MSDRVTMRFRRLTLSLTVLFLLLGLASLAEASGSLSVSSAVVNPGGSSSLSVGLNVSGSAPAGVEWTISYVAAQVSVITITPGPATVAAAKSLFCSSGAGSATCIISGANANLIGSGVVAYLNVTVAPGTSAASILIASSLGVDANGNTLTITPGAAGTLIVPSLLPMTCSAVLNMGATGACTVTLSQPAPPGGTAVLLGSNNGMLTVPASVTVNAGATTATFNAVAGPSFANNQSATVTSTLGSSSQAAIVSLIASVVSGLSCNPASLLQAAVSTCTVTLSQAAPAGGSAVTLGSNSLSLAVPAIVTVPVGATTATFSATAGASLLGNQNAAVTANLGSSSQTAPISLIAPVVSTLTCNPANLVQAAASTCIVTVSQTAPAGGSSVTLSSNSPSLSVPATLTVAAGTTTATFSAVAAASLSVNQSAIVTATLGGGSQTTGVNLIAPVVSTLVCTPTTLGQGAVSICTVTVSQAAPPVGSAVALASDNAALTVPLTVTVTAGATAATFYATAAAAIATNQIANLTAALSGTPQTAAISLVTPVISALSCNPASLGQSAVSTCTVTVSQTAPASGSVVTLASNSLSLTVPPAVTVAAGAITATFNATAAASLLINQNATVTATLGSSSQAATIGLLTPVVSALVCNPANLGPGAVSGCVVTVSQIAPAGGTTVSLAGNNASLTIPATVTVPTGAVTALFSVAAASSIPANQTVTMTAALGSSSQTVTVNLLAPVLVSALACNPPVLGQSAVSTCTVTLSQPAPLGSPLTLVHVTDCGPQNFPGSPCTIPPTGKGNLIVVGFQAPASASSLSTIADNAGNIYAEAGAAQAVDTAQGVLVDLWYARNSVAGATAITVTPGAGVSGSGAVIWEFSGADPSAPLDQTAVLSSQPPTLTPSGAPVTITAQNEIVISIAGVAFPLTGMATGNAFIGDSALLSDGWAHLVTSATGAYYPQWNQIAAGTFGSSTASFKAASATTVMLSGNNPSLLMPASLTIPAGATSATFTATAAASIANNQSAALTATLGASSQSATVVLLAPVLVSTLVCNPATLGQSAAGTCTVTLTQTALAGGATVTLASNNPSLTVPPTVTVAAGATTATFTATSAASLANNQSATVTAALGPSSQTAAVSLIAPVVSALACTPVSLGQGAVSTCTVTVSQAAPAGGSAVSLATNNPSLTLPSSVTIAAGSTSASFSATAAIRIASNQSAAVTATLGISAQTATLSLIAPVVSSLACSPTSLGQSAVSACTLTMSQTAPAGGSPVTVASNSPSLNVPATVMIPAGSATAIFPATAAASLASNQSVTVTATLGGSSQTAAIGLIAPVISALACNPTSLAQSAVSTCTVTVSQTAPVGGSAVTLAGNNPLLTVPASVIVAAGSTTAIFPATAAASLAGNQSATVTATLSGSSQTATFALIAPVISALACNPGSLGQSAVSTCTVTVSQTAPPGGTSIILASNSVLLNPPASVIIPSGSTTATFSAKAAAVIANNQSATLTATLGGSSQAAPISLMAPVLVSALVCNPSSLGQSAISTCTISLTQNAPSGGAAVTLASSTTSLTVLPGVTVAAGATTATFSATAAAFLASNQSALLTATLGVSSQSATITLIAPVVSALSCNPTSLGQSAISTCTLTVTQTARSGGTAVSLASSNASLSVPASVTIPAGAATATFPATAAATITSNQSATVTATLGGSAQTTNISLLAPVLISTLACNPPVLGPGALSICLVTLTQNAPSGGASLTLISSNALLAIPASVTVATAANTATFTASAAASIPSNQSATLTAALGASSQTSVISLTATVLVSSLTCDLVAGQTAVSACIVTLTQNAPAGGISVALTSSNVLLTVPPSVTVSAGAATATFLATGALAFTVNQSAIVTATYGASSQSVTINGATVVPAFVQEKDSQINSGKIVSTTFSSPTTAGNLLVVYLIWDNAGIASVTDSLGNTYSTAARHMKWNSGKYSVQVFYATSLIGGPDTVKATFASTVTSFGVVYAHEYSGVAQTAPLDVTAMASSTSGPLYSGFATTTNPIDLIFVAGASLNSLTGPGSGYTARSTSLGNITEDKIVSATGSYWGGAGGNGGPWAMQLVAFRAATGPVNLSHASENPQAGLSALTLTSRKQLGRLRCSPGTMTAGATATCELFVAPGSQSVPVQLRTSNEMVRVPAVVTTRPDQSSLTFQASSDAASRQRLVTITATLPGDGAEVADSVLIMAAPGPVLRAPGKLPGKTGAWLSFTVGVTDPSDLPFLLAASALPAGASFDPLTGIFAWSPRPSQAGKYQLTFTAANSARQSSSAQVELEIGAGIPALRSPAPACSPGGIATFEGSFLAPPNSQLADPSGASFDLGGTRVIVNGQAVPVLFSAADRVDFLCPTLAAGTRLVAGVVSGEGAGMPVTFEMQEQVPAILLVRGAELNQGLISFPGTSDLAMDRNFRLPSHPAQPGDDIVIFATGFEAAADPSPATILVKLGEVYAAAESVQAVSGYAGVRAIQVRVPAGMEPGTIAVQLRSISASGRQVDSAPVTAVFEAVRQ